MRALTAADADAAYAAAQVVVETHRRVSGFLRAGQKLTEIDTYIARQLEDQGARSCFLGYTPAPRRLPPFPSHACLSVNECVVHGTASSLRRELREGDVLKVDIGVWYKGWVGDAAWTYVFGTPHETARRLMECGKRSLGEGVKELAPGKPLSAWAGVVQRIVEEEGKFHLIRGLGGHGLYDPRKGKATLHGPPFIANRMPEAGESWSEASQRCEPGLLVAVEPMIAIGTGFVSDKKGLAPHQRWPEVTVDGSLSVHYEHDVLVTEHGPRVLTEGLEHIPDVITR